MLDTGKAIAALLTNGGEPLDYLEVIGRGETDQPGCRAVHRHSDYSRHRSGSHPQRGFGFAGTPGEG